MTSGASWCVLLATAVTLQGVVGWGAGRRLPIGDEVEYLDRCRRPDPYSPEPFLRVPLFIAFLRLGGGREPLLRTLLGLVALASVVLTALAGQLAAGAAGVLAVGGVFVLMPDRWILSHHLWPDTLLGLWNAALLALTVAAGTGLGVPPWAFGVVAAAAVSTRLDALAVLPILAAHPLFRGEDGLLPALGGLWGPSLLALALFSAINARRYGRALPDDTTWFNLQVLWEEHGRPGRAVDEWVSPAWDRWATTAKPRGPAALAPFAWSPGALLRGLPFRAWSLLGADTFARDRLLIDPGGAYPELVGTVRRGVRFALRGSFPLLVALALAGLVPGFGGLRAPSLLLVAGFVAISLVHSRTRFRFALLPYLALYAGLGLLQMMDRVHGLQAWIVFGATASILLQAPARNERIRDEAI